MSDAKSDHLKIVVSRSALLVGLLAITISTGLWRNSIPRTTLPSAPPDDIPVTDQEVEGTNATKNSVERSRAWSGLWAVAVGDAAIAIAAAYGVYTTGSGPVISAILTSAFTAIATMTTAYFGIKSISNTAQSYNRSNNGEFRIPPSSG